jgi:GDP-mannose transporter
MSNKKLEDLEMGGITGEKLSELERSTVQPVSHHHQLQVDSGTVSILAQLESNPGAAILAYCFSSISMTVVNKYVVSGSAWNLNFLYLAIQVRTL